MDERILNDVQSLTNISFILHPSAIVYAISDEVIPIVRMIRIQTLSYPLS